MVALSVIAAARCAGCDISQESNNIIYRATNRQTELLIRQVCPGLYKECVKDDRCHAEFVESLQRDARQNPQQSDAMTALVRCFADAHAHGQLEDPVVSDQMAFVSKVVHDIACDACGLVVEDLWSQILRDWGTIDSSGRAGRGHETRQKGAPRVARESLEALCTVPSPAHEAMATFYDVLSCRGSGYPERHAAGVCTAQGQRWWITRMGSRLANLSKGADVAHHGQSHGAQREWQLAAYNLLCVERLQPAVVDISEAIYAQFQPQSTQHDTIRSIGDRAASASALASSSAKEADTDVFKMLKLERARLEEQIVFATNSGRAVVRERACYDICAATYGGNSKALGKKRVRKKIHSHRHHPREHEL